MGRNEDVWDQNHARIKEILTKAYTGISKGKLAEYACLSRPTINLHLKKFEKTGQIKMEDRLVYWKASYERYAPWLRAFDMIVEKLNAVGLGEEWLKQNQGIVITPRGVGFAPADPEKLKDLIDRMWECAPPGSIVTLVKAAGKIEKGTDVRIVNVDKQSFLLVAQANANA